MSKAFVGTAKKSCADCCLRLRREENCQVKPGLLGKIFICFILPTENNLGKTNRRVVKTVPMPGQMIFRGITPMPRNPRTWDVMEGRFIHKTVGSPKRKSSRLFRRYNPPEWRHMAGRSHESCAGQNPYKPRAAQTSLFSMIDLSTAKSLT